MVPHAGPQRGLAVRRRREAEEDPQRHRHPGHGAAWQRGPRDQHEHGPGQERHL